MIDLSAVAALRAVDEHGSVVSAAEALGFTPSAVSQQVKRLERQAGVALLERVGRGVLLTGAGRRLVGDGERLLAEMERIEADLQADQGAVVGSVRVTAFATAMRGVVAPAARLLRETQPDLRLVLAEAEPWDTVDLVGRGRADVGVVHAWGDVALSVPDHLVETDLGRDLAEVVLPPGHRLAGRTSVTPHDLAGESWIATPAGTICREWLERMHVGAARPVIAHQAREFDTHVALVEAGLGIALVPHLGRAPLPEGLTTVQVSDPVPIRSVVAYHRRSQASSPAVAAVLAALRASWGNDGAADGPVPDPSAEARNRTTRNRTTQNRADASS